MTWKYWEKKKTRRRVPKCTPKRKV